MTKNAEKAGVATSRKYSDGGKMKPSKNLTESKRSTSSKSKKVSANRSLVKVPDHMRKMVAVPDDGLRSPIVFDDSIRKVFVRGVLEDIKGYFESKTDGKVEISYEERDLGSYEFGFKLTAKRGIECTRQLFSEAEDAIVNVVDFMFPAAEDRMLDVSSSREAGLLEVEIYSAW